MSSDTVDIDVLIADINKREKDDETIVKGSTLKHKTWQRVTSGSLGLDLALGGGWPLNSPNEIIGQPSSGKTTTAIKTIAANQALDTEVRGGVGGGRGLRLRLGANVSAWTSTESSSSPRT